jgi:hypothetical protein
MDTAGNKDVVRRLYTLINEGRVEQVADLIAPDYQEHDPLPGQGSGREGAVDRFSMITTGLAPHFTVEDLIAEGRPSRCPLDERRHTCRRLRRHPSDRSTVHHRRHRHLPRRGRTVVREHWHVIDQLGMLGQLRLLPQGAEGPRSSAAPIDARASAAGSLASINA